MKGYTETIIATNKTNPVLMKIARRERWIKPFAKKLTAEDAAKVKELRFEKLFVAYLPAGENDEMLLSAGDGTYTTPITINFTDINLFESETITDSSGNSYCFSDDEKFRHPYTFGIWNALPDAGLEHFDEFQYFTGVTSIPPYAFYGFKQLRSIKFPPNIKKIGRRAFDGCTSLESIETDFSLEDIVKLTK